MDVNTFLAALAGFGTGLTAGVLIVGRRYLRTLEAHTGFAPIERAGTITAPPKLAEDRIENLFSEDAIENGARELMALAASAGQALDYDGARAMARQALLDSSPVSP